MNAPVPLPAPVRRGPSRWKLLFWLLLVPAALAAAYFAVVLNWNYSSGERAGWVQKLSKRGWICKTWEGEMVMVSMPGAIPEKFLFTVHDDNLAAEINKLLGRRVTLHYEEKVGLPTTCFGDTRHFVVSVSAVEGWSLGSDMPAPGVPPATVPPTATPPAAASPAPMSPAPTPLPPADPAPPASAPPPANSK